MGRLIRLLAPVMLMLLVAAACGEDDDRPALSGGVEQDSTDGEAGADQASASFTSPADGDTVARRFSVTMDATGVEIEPAGDVREGAGHFHVMVDTECVTPGEAIPRDAQHVHFGKGQQSGQLFLEPGEHTLCLQVGDGAHAALAITDELAVTVDPNPPYVTLSVPEGETVTSPLNLTMEVHGATVEPAGEVRLGSGHFHLMVDADCVPAGETIPQDDQHLHFGDGSTTAELELPAGEHRLCLQLGDGAHAALPFTHEVTVTVA